jgi:hypothetical protein
MFHGEFQPIYIIFQCVASIGEFSSVHPLVCLQNGTVMQGKNFQTATCKKIFVSGGLVDSVLKKNLFCPIIATCVSTMKMLLTFVSANKLVMLFSSCCYIPVFEYCMVFFFVCCLSSKIEGCYFCCFC